MVDALDAYEDPLPIIGGWPEDCGTAPVLVNRASRIYHSLHRWQAPCHLTAVLPSGHAELMPSWRHAHTAGYTPCRRCWHGVADGPPEE